MKRFKDGCISNSNLSTAQAVIPPGRTYRYAPKSGPRPPAPAQGINVPYKALPKSIPDKYKQALRILEGKLDLDQRNKLKDTAIGATLTYALSNFSSLSSLDSHLGSVAKILAYMQILSGLSKLLGAGARGLWSRIPYINPTELTKLKNRQYKITTYRLAKDSSGTLVPTGTGTKLPPMTLEEIADSIEKGQPHENFWATNGLAYVFEDPDELAKLARMFEHNDYWDKFTKGVEIALPFVLGAAGGLGIWNSIKASDKRFTQAGDTQRNDTTGTVKGFTKLTPQQDAERKEQHEARQKSR
jgi:hypothetical protein